MDLYIVGIISMHYTTEFKKYHQLTLTILKQFGFGKMGGVMELRIQGEVADMVAELKASDGQPIYPMHIVDVSVMNVIASILFGKRFERNDALVRTFLEHNSIMVTTASRTIPMSIIPALFYIPYYKSALEEMKACFDWYDKILQQKVDECESDETQTPCFIRSFIEAEGKETYNRVQLVRTLQDLVLAGSETSSTTLMWSIMLLANHQDIQSRLQAEIDDVVPRDRLPSLDDRTQLTFVEAFILELMRYKTIVPIGVAHEASSDTVIQGFFIPANTIVSV